MEHLQDFKEVFLSDPVPENPIVGQRKGYIEDSENIDSAKFFEGKKWAELESKLYKPTNS